MPDSGPKKPCSARWTSFNRRLWNWRGVFEIPQIHVVHKLLDIRGEELVQDTGDAVLQRIAFVVRGGETDQHPDESAVQREHHVPFVQEDSVGQQKIIG